MQTTVAERLSKVVMLAPAVAVGLLLVVIIATVWLVVTIGLFCFSPFIRTWATSGKPPLPELWASDRLKGLRSDRAEARARICEVLYWLVDRHRSDVKLPPTVITRAVNAAACCADDMISDATREIESELERELDEEIDRVEKRFGVSASPSGPGYPNRCTTLQRPKPL